MVSLAITLTHINEFFICNINAVALYQCYYYIEFCHDRVKHQYSLSDETFKYFQFWEKMAIEKSDRGNYF